MKFLDYFKTKVTEPVHHEDEDNLNLSEGAHILVNCKNVVLSSNVCVLESTDTDYIEVGSRSKIQVFHSGKIKLLCGHAKIGMVKTGIIEKMTENSEITTVNFCQFEYVSGNAKIGTFNNGIIKFMDKNSYIPTFNSGQIMFMRDNAKIGTLITGTVDGIQNKAQIDTIMNGKIGYMLNKAKIGTINSGEVNELCDSARIDTINDGDVNHMMGNSMIYQQIGGEVKNRTGQALLIYTQKQERNLESQIEMNIEDVIIKKPAKRVGRKKIFDDL